MAGRPRVLLVSSTRLPHVVRYALAARDTGLDVALLAPPGQPVAQLDWVRTVGRFSGRQAAGSVVRAIEQFPVDLVVPVDDPAAAAVFAAHDRATSATTRALIARSMGDPATFPVRHDRNALGALAQELGILTPPSRPVADEAEVDRAVDELGLPAVVKIDGTYGGLGVQVAHERDAARRAFAQLTSQSAAQGRASVQRFVVGDNASTTVLAWEGRVLSCVSLRVLQSSSAFGSSTVLEPVDNPDMSRATGQLAGALGLSGFFGLDFILSADGRAHLLELNPRITATAAVWFGGEAPMLSLLAGRLGLPVPPPPSDPVPAGPVAMFPQELGRDPRSSYLRTAHHDVPWHAPDVVGFCCDQVEPPRTSEKALRVGRGLIATSAPRVRLEARRARRLSG